MRPATIAIAVCLVLSGPGARATHSESGIYLVAGPPVVGVTCSPDCMGVPGANLGGYSFAPSGHMPTQVVVDDLSDAPIWFAVTQDLDGDGISGNDDSTIGAIEPRVEACGAVAELGGAVIPFDPSAALDVSIAIADPIACEGSLALGGTITVVYA